ncbi:hypothetical protein TREMEDRAFT_15322, partial [Tremella mesenterica DSM 1558]|uniref:uncharacterized protein n=1 Tax=Tremella mesenterica (strain ATCC 24925 / CBS 8224 / DSM 1558 / NBRC 9311 / NRRL Y-6157 / RJB 2259-6 / UBC 559-6) TaxID=578456 RepID=UPI0003F48F4A
PFGPFNFIHEYNLSHAKNLTFTNWPCLYVIPLIPLGVQAYLLQFENTRRWRLALGALGLGLIVKAWCDYRFVDITLSAFNQGITVGVLHLAAKYIEFSFYPNPIYDPRLPLGRSRILAAIDLCVNSRVIDLSLSGSNHKKPLAHASLQNAEDNQSRSIKSERSDDVAEHQTAGKTHSHPRYLPTRPAHRLTRSQAVWRHARLALFQYTINDFLLTLLQVYGSNSIADPHGCPNALYKFSHEHKFQVFPYTPFSFNSPVWLVELSMELSVGLAVYLGLSQGYHFLAALAVGSGMWETESWEVDLFDSPWKADSVLDLWGKRWHQLFRHHFTLLSSLLLRFLNLPQSSPLFLPISVITIFAGSGSMHVIGELSSYPVPPPIPIFNYFVLSGFACSLEVLFRRVTGRKVRGWWGRAWTWAFMLYTSRKVMIAWLDAGMAGGVLNQPALGSVIAKVVAKWVV